MFFLRGFDMQPLFRTGNLFQAVLLSSYISDVSVRPPLLHGRYPAPNSPEAPYENVAFVMKKPTLADTECVDRSAEYTAVDVR
jgi:hypothetical protein